MSEISVSVCMGYCIRVHRRGRADGVLRMSDNGTSTKLTLTSRSYLCPTYVYHILIRSIHITIHHQNISTD